MYILNVITDFSITLQYYPTVYLLAPAGQYENQSAAEILSPLTGGCALQDLLKR